MDGLGEFLKSERLIAKATIIEISKKTNIPEKIIKALEENDYSKIPGKFYLKNFVKNYLLAMELDYDGFLLKHNDLIENIPFTIDKKADYLNKMRYSKFENNGFFIKPVIIIALFFAAFFLIYKNLDQIKTFLTPEKIVNLKELPQTKLHLESKINLIGYGFNNINYNDPELLETQFNFSKDKWAVDLVIIVNKKNWITMFQNGKKIIGRDYTQGEVLKLKGYNFYFHTQFASAIDIIVNGKGLTYFKDKIGYQKLLISPENMDLR